MNKVSEISIQISVLSSIDWQLSIRKKEGLCNAIKRAYLSVTGDYFQYKTIENYLHLFTFKNASQFKAKRGIYWWEINDFGYKCRREFINWIINKLKSMLRLISTTLNSIKSAGFKLNDTFNQGQEHLGVALRTYLARELFKGGLLQKDIGEILNASSREISYYINKRNDTEWYKEVIRKLNENI